MTTGSARIKKSLKGVGVVLLFVPIYLLFVVVAVLLVAATWGVWLIQHGV